VSIDELFKSRHFDRHAALNELQKADLDLFSKLAGDVRGVSRCGLDEDQLVNSRIAATRLELSGFASAVFVFELHGRTADDLIGDFPHDDGRL
jgi:hypothetical protein